MTPVIKMLSSVLDIPQIRSSVGLLARTATCTVPLVFYQSDHCVVWLTVLWDFPFKTQI